MAPVTMLAASARRAESSWKARCSTRALGLVGEARGAEDVHLVARLDLAGVDVVELGGIGQAGHGQRALARDLAAGVHAGHQGRVDLAAQLLAGRGQRAAGGGQVRVFRQAFLDQRVQLGRAIALPPLRHRLGALFIVLGHALRRGAGGGQGLHAVLGRLRRGGRLAVGGEGAGAQRQHQRQDGQAYRDARGFHGGHCCAPARSSCFTRNQAA